MGTYLTAYVECRHSDDSWWPLAEFDLRKTYALILALEGASTAGWPKDTRLHESEAKSDCYAKQTSTMAQLRTLRATSAPWHAWERAYFRAILDCAEALVRAGYEARVLWGRD